MASPRLVIDLTRSTQGGSLFGSEQAMLDSSGALDLTTRRLFLCQHLGELVAVIRTAARQLVGATFVLRDGDHVFYAEEMPSALFGRAADFPSPPAYRVGASFTGHPS